jgi:RecA/RadA recombinase
VSKDVRAVKAALKSDVPRKPPIGTGDWLSLGCTVLNLAVSGRATGGIARGQCLRYVGDSSSGKTWFALNLFAEASLSKHFKDYRFIFDNAENGAYMDVLEYYGPGVAGRLEEINSDTVEEFYYTLHKAQKAGRPFIYVLDSMDALDSEADEAAFESNSALHDEGKPPKGTYGMAKAKSNSQNIRRSIRSLRESGSVLVILNQTREKVNTGLPFPVKTYAGGRALKFYGHVELWTSISEDLTRNVRLRPGAPLKKREYGKLLKVDVRKNRVSGWEGQVEVTFLRKHGIDDVGTTVDYLVNEGHWKKAKEGGKIAAPEFRFSGSRDKLVRKVQDEDLERELQLLAQKVWQEIDDLTRVKRKKRYE